MNIDIRSLSPWVYGVLHLVVAALVIVVPQLLMQNHVGDITISAVVLGALHWLEQKTAQ